MKNKLLTIAGLALIAGLTFNHADASAADKAGTAAGNTKVSAAQNTAAAKKGTGKKPVNAMSTAEKTCMAILGLRLGDAYKKKTTDRREAKNEAGNDTFSIVGTAESRDDNLSFICKLEHVNGKFNITEFKLMRVVPQDSVNFDEGDAAPTINQTGMMAPSVAK